MNRKMMDESKQMAFFPDVMRAVLQLDGAQDDTPELDEDGLMTRALVPLRGMVLFPQMVTPLFVGREISLAAIQAATAAGESLIVATQRDATVEEPLPEHIYNIGVDLVLGRVIRLPDNNTSVLSHGRQRVEIVEYLQTTPYIRVRVRPIPEETYSGLDTDALKRAVLDLLEDAVSLDRKLPDDALTYAMNIENPGWLADFIASVLDLPIEIKQQLLENADAITRLQDISILLGREIDLLETENRIHNRVHEEIDKNQREHFLREQMRAIQGELGETDIFAQDLSELKKTAAKKKMPDDVRAKVEKEISRISMMAPMSPEVGVIRTYLDWLLDLPWCVSSNDNLNVKRAAKILEREHYSLDKVKDRILEYIAVRHIAADNMRTPILCFVGPPGTGKTSIARSIAHSLKRKFVRLSLGGVRDESQIRGHRRTYIGALPGRIIHSIRRAKTNNPLFVLDEIDKLGSDFRGDPSAALLEVLDPEQNNAFQDHYLELDFDLSKVMFITTANSLHSIPSALLDRMEVIEFSGYLEEEKIEIARRYIIPRQLKEHGLKGRGLRFEKSAIQRLIREYTYESGVRNLEREIATLYRKIARAVVEDTPYSKRITDKQVGELLGPPRTTLDPLREADEVGVVNGLAWTSVGGEVLVIEVNVMRGKGNMRLTGQLGNVMQESAQAALTYVRSQADVLGIDPDRFENTDIHLHVPQGAVPKDGPSAGAAMVVALASAFTGRMVRRDVAMTGEITLRGRVLPIGGLRDKALAAQRLGVQTVILPKRNAHHLDDIPDTLRDKITFVLADHVDVVLQTALHPVET